MQLKLGTDPAKFKPTPGMVLAVFDAVGIEYHLSHKETLIRCPFHDDSGHKRHCYVNVREKAGIWHCFKAGCGAKGDFMDLIVGITKWNAYKTLIFCRQFMEAEMPDLPTAPDPPSEEELDRYRFWHPYLYDRGLSKDTLRHWGIGYDKEENAIIIPWRDTEGSLCGIKRRYLITKRYIMTEGFKPTLFGAQFVIPHKSVVWLFEAEFDAMLVDQIFSESTDKDFACALGGSDLSEGQFKQLLKLDPSCVVLFLDNDAAGVAGIEKLSERLLGRLPHVAVEYPDWAKKDPGELSRTELLRIISEVKERVRSNAWV